MDTTSFCVTMVPGLNCAQLAKGGLSTVSSGPGLADWAPTEYASPTIRIPAAATTRRHSMGNLLAANPFFGLDSSVPEFGKRSKEKLAARCDVTRRFGRGGRREVRPN